MQVERRRILDLSSDPANVRTHDDRNIDAIAASLRRFGQQKPIVVDANGVVRAGNGTLEAAKRLGWEAIEVVRSDLAGSEATAYAIADNRTAELAEWDEAALAAQLGALKAEDAELLADAGFTEAELADAQMKQETKYSTKVSAPIYEPTGDCPDLADLIDRTESNNLVHEIYAAQYAPLPEEVKKFLRYAAERHTIFHYDKIAEYYAHAPAEIQHLMERSALVVIDFDAAVERGFVKLDAKMAELFRQEVRAESGDPAGDA